MKNPAAGSDPNPGHVAGLPKAYSLVFALLGAATILLLLWGLDDESLWLDELFSVWVSGVGGVSEVLEKLRADVHPPLYFLMLWGWIQAFGDSEVSVRGMSAIAYLMAVGLVFWGARRLHGPRIAWIATLALATSYQVLVYAREVRPYAWLLLASAALTVGWLGLVRSLRSGGRDARFDRTWIALFAAGGVLASSLHYYGLLLTGVACSCLVLMAMRADARALRAATWILCVSVGGLSLGIVGGWLAYSVELGPKLAPGGFWIERPNLLLLLRIGRFFGGTIVSSAIILPVVLWAAYRGTSTVSRGLIRDDSIRPAIVLALAVGVLALASSFLVPTLTPRNLIGLLPAFWIAAAESLDRIMRPRAALAFGAAISAVSLAAAAWMIMGTEKEQAREAVDIVAREAREDGARLIVFNSPAIEFSYWDYYLRRYPERFRGIKMSNDAKELESMARAALQQGRAASVVIGYLHARGMEQDFGFLRTALADVGCTLWDGKWTFVVSCRPSKSPDRPATSLQPEPGEPRTPAS